MMDFSKYEWGLVLNGGGGKAAYQVGVLKALFEHKINDYITAVSGTSSGSLNMILFVNDDFETAKAAWDSVEKEDFLEISPDMIDFKEGLVSREGLISIFDRYIDFEKIRTSDKTMYATVSDYGENDCQKGVAKYYRLNYKSESDIKKILIASSALPIIYEPVIIDGHVCRDGGLTDNMPINPLYIEGIRHFIVVGLSDSTEINKEKYPGAEFLLIHPGKSIGNFFNGTLDFSRCGIETRMELGYLDAIRELEFYGKKRFI